MSEMYDHVYLTVCPITYFNPRLVHLDRSSNTQKQNFHFGWLNDSVSSKLFVSQLGTDAQETDSESILQRLHNISYSSAIFE